MINEQRLVDANKLTVCYVNTGTVMFPKIEAFVRADDIADAEIVDAVEVVRVEAVKQEILAKMDEFYAEYRRISESYVDHFGGKADAMDVARRLVNAALTDLCESCRTKTAGGKADGK